MRLDPGFTHQNAHFLGSAYLVAGQYDAAAAAFRERIRLMPKTDLSRAFLASALGHLEESAEAQRVWHELKDVNPRYSFEDLARLPFQNQADADKIRQGLAKAGFQTEPTCRLAAMRRWQDRKTANWPLPNRPPPCSSPWNSRVRRGERYDSVLRGFSL